MLLGSCGVILGVQDTSQSGYLSNKVANSPVVCQRPYKRIIKECQALPKRIAPEDQVSGDGKTE
jgi:hypothetical protein